MADRTIELFMWGFQDGFRHSLDILAERSFELLGAPTEPAAILVGVRKEGGRGHPICIEPETGPLRPSDLDGLFDRANVLYQEDPESTMSYGAAWINEKKHREANDRAVGRAIVECFVGILGPSMRWTAGLPTLVEEHYVYPVIGVPQEAFDAAPRLLTETMFDGRLPVTKSLVEGVVAELLRVAAVAMREPNAGANLGFDFDAADVVRTAGRMLSQSVVILSGNDFHSTFHDAMNRIATTRYEKREGAGRIVLASPNSAFIEQSLVFTRAVRLRETRTARKVLEMSAASGPSLHTDGTEVLGLAQVVEEYDPTTESVFEVHIGGYGSWSLSHAGVPLMAVQDGAPRLPAPPLTEDRFNDLINRVLGPDEYLDTELLWRIAWTAVDVDHGTMLVIATDAADEAVRLGGQGLQTHPAVPNDELIRRVTNIDGAVLLDAAGRCHAAGIIVDGLATENGDRARGARYNSAVRYLESRAERPTVIVLVSEDGMVNLLPDLMPRIARAYLDDMLSGLRSAANLEPQNHEQFYKAKQRVRSYAFYLSEQECTEVNDLEQAYNGRRVALGGGSVTSPPLAASPALNDTYFL